MRRLKAHAEIKASLCDEALLVLDAFAAIQNRHEGALSEAAYGMILCPNAKNKKEGFHRAVQMAANELVKLGY